MGKQTLGLAWSQWSVGVGRREGESPEMESAYFAFVDDLLFLWHHWPGRFSLPLPEINTALTSDVKGDDKYC